MISKKPVQYRTQMIDMRYIALLRLHGRSTVRQLCEHTSECEDVTRKKLADLRKRGVISGEMVWRKLEYWIE